MAFTAKDVAKLRDATGAGMMACKKALEQTDGDIEKATEYLREQGVAIAAKKASRIASEGIVSAYIDGNTGVLVEVNCESDFVAKSDVFVELGNSIAKLTAQNRPADLDALLQIKTNEGTVSDIINNATSKIGEKISIRRFCIQSIDKGMEEAYIHMGGKMGVLLEIASDSDISKNEQIRETAHDIAMHIAAFSPNYVCKEDVPADEVAHEKSILTAQFKNDPSFAKKPPAVVEKIIEGRLGKFFTENCLIYQEFAKDSTITVENLVNQTASKHGVKLSIKQFTRFVMGEGLEKKQDNLADEVAKLSGN